MVGGFEVYTTSLHLLLYVDYMNTELQALFSTTATTLKRCKTTVSNRGWGVFQ